MPTTTPRHTARRAAVTAALALTTALAIPAGALAANAPTFGPPAITPAGQPAPIAIPGNHLGRGDTIPEGMQILRWAVTLNGASDDPTALVCPAGTIVTGIGEPEGNPIGFGVVQPAHSFENTVNVRFDPAPHVDPNGATGSMYVLCRDLSAAPLAPLVFPTTVVQPGRRSPVNVLRSHPGTGARIVRAGGRIPKGDKLERTTIALVGRRTGNVTLSCPTGMAAEGLGSLRDAKLGVDVVKGASFGHRAIKIRVTRQGHNAFNMVTASVYTLCG